MTTSRMRIGHGYDVHRLQPGGGVVLGGVKIPCALSIVAHSDGDVLIHALCDALLGAMGGGDIGHLFPDTDPQYRGADSRSLLRRVMEKVRSAGYAVGNADLTLIAQAPRVAAHVPQMRQYLAADLGIDPADVNLKATTPEKLDAFGRQEGLAAHAVVMLYGGG